jgi:hypothetical protein
MVVKDLAKITYRLHDQRAKLEPSLKLRRHHLTSAFHAQISSEKDFIQSHVGRLQPAIQKVYLQHCLAMLNERAKMEPVGL